jgi:hypothetical protein
MVHPPLILYVPLQAEPVKFPLKPTTCPAMGAEVRDVPSAVILPVRLIVVSRSKQFEPAAWSASLTAGPIRLILPENVSGALPGKVDAAVNCQLPIMVGVWGAEVRAELSGAGTVAPPDPQKRTVTEE